MWISALLIPEGFLGNGLCIALLSTMSCVFLGLWDGVIFRSEDELKSPEFEEGSGPKDATPSSLSQTSSLLDSGVNLKGLGWSILGS